MVSQSSHHRPKKTAAHHARLRDVNVFPKFERDVPTTPPQDVLGISDEQLGGLFHIAWAFLEHHEAPDAVRSFTLLCHLNPFVADFWYGLGRALRECGQAEDALSSLLMAETIDSGRGEFYLEEVECCLDLGNKREARHILNRMCAHKRTIAEFSESVSKIRELYQRAAGP